VVATTGGDVDVAERRIALLVRGSFGGEGGGGSTTAATRSLRAIGAIVTE